MKEVAIIIPAYNAEKTISNTIESILSQTYDDYEVIIVNDHSSDGTKRICEEYEQKNKDKIKFFDNLKEKKGVSSARNYGITKSNAKYIMFIDSDDSFEKQMLTNMLEEIQENDLVVCGYKKCGKDEIIHSLGEDKKAANIQEIKILIEELQKADLFNESCNKIFKSEIVKEKKLIFPENISLGEDYRFVLDYVEHCKSIKFINKVLYRYNRTEGGLALRYDENNLKVRLDNIKYNKDFYIRNNLDTDYLDKAYVLSMFSGFAEIVRNTDKKTAKELLQKYAKDRNIEKQLDEIKNKKLNIFIKILKMKNAKINYCLGKIYNLMKKMIKK